MNDIVTPNPINPSMVESSVNSRQLKKEIQLEKAGVERTLVYKRLAEGLSADKVESAIIDGELLETRNPDMVIRHKYIETALKLYGDLVPEGGSVSVVNIDQRTNEEILKRVKEAIIAKDSL